MPAKSHAPAQSLEIGRPLRSRTALKTPIGTWSAIGAVLLLVEVAVFVSWVAGPHFKAVPSGPTPVPGSLDVAIRVIEVLSVLALLGFLYWFLVRPWRRERQVTADGMFCVALLLVSFYDPACAYFKMWFAYNSHLVNFGNPLAAVPGFHGDSTYSAFAWPVFWVPSFYVYAVLPLMMLGSWAMRRLRARNPGLPWWALVGACFGGMVVMELILEPVVFMRLHLYAEWSEPALGSGNTVEPLVNLIFASLLFTALSCLRFFRDDRGLTLAERGADRIVNRRTALLRRFLAVIALTQVIFFVCYHIPVAIWTGSSSSHVSSYVSKRSYLLDHFCGPGTRRPCP
jgi:hypothetical protein